ncbi:sortase-like acyltransferase [Galbibacter orientalis DSM 19592]|uniref:Sortase-like acyltransferase n=1 Tax=Galbibacter orientalis DSM 19592 TaxID=926559 RepID=I3C2I8_9FLAO|nr:GNAT family N-acetyltransferase [Galbibacter orientalis]EIJ37831.1 sortase-like acyltransferase [Galbibacter orientalis DSM 19592]
MEYRIRLAEEKDMSQVLELIQELADFEKEPEAVEVSVEDLVNDGFGENPLFKCFVGEVNNKIEGMALFYNRYSTWKGKTIHLEDLVVRKSSRGTGLGSALFAEVIKYGHNLGVKRIEWVVLDWNTPAVKFYEKNGANILRDWDTVQLDEQGIKNFIANTNS